MLTIHAICQSSVPLEFDVEGVSDDDRVFSVHSGDFCAVVRENSGVPLSKMDRETALKELIIHQRIVEGLMPHGPLLPVKFGTNLPAERDVLKLLEQVKGLASQTLSNYAGKVQMEISVLWDTANVFLALSQTMSVVEMKQKAEEGDQEARRQLGIHVKELMDEKRDVYTQEILPALRAVTGTMVVHPVMADEVVMNAALLLETKDESLLDDVLAGLDRQYNGAFTIRCMGPMPLYSFATLTAEKVDPVDIEKACQMLELPSSATLEGVKRAYRKKAQQIHPDMNAMASNESNQDMTELTSAYQLLMAFAKSQLIDSDQMEGERCHFDREAVENTLLIGLETQLVEAQVPVSS